jgi:hypothetical protein
MDLRRHAASILIVALVILCVAACVGLAQEKKDAEKAKIGSGDIIVEELIPIPEAREEIITIEPSEEHIWIPGCWERKPDEWKWITGHWGKPPHKSARWVKGHWTNKPRPEAEWIPAHWEKAGKSGYSWPAGHWNVK